MSHIDPDRLAIEALDGATLDGTDLTHLAQCARCADDLRSLSRTVRAGRAGAPDGLSTPSERVWEAIAAEVAADAPVAPEGAPASGASSGRHRAVRRSRRPLVTVIFGAATAAAVIAIALVILFPRPVGIADATLDAFPGHPGARGTAELEREPDGSERVRVSLDADVPGDGFREVWLITADGSALVSLGVLDGRAGSFAVPRDIDTSRFTIVDISQEPTGGGAEHSGDSIVRGTLTTS